MFLICFFLCLVRNGDVPASSCVPCVHFTFTLLSSWFFSATASSSCDCGVLPSKLPHSGSPPSVVSLSPASLSVLSPPLLLCMSAAVSLNLNSVGVSVETFIFVTFFLDSLSASSLSAFFFPSRIHFYSPFLHRFEPYPGGVRVDNPPSGAYKSQPYTDGRYIGIQLSS